MQATLPIDTIWNLLVPLSYDNKKWLADKLYEDIHSSTPIDKMEARLERLSLLKEGWEGNNAKPIHPAVINNMRAVLHQCKEKDIMSWLLFPDVDGNLYLDFKSDETDAGIVLSETSFSYFANDKNEKDIPFSPSMFIQVMNSINDITL